MKNILRDSLFGGKPFGSDYGHGGNRRTSQIEYLINSAGSNLLDIKKGNPTILNCYYHGIKFFIKYRPKITLHKTKLFNIGKEYCNYISSLKENDFDRIFIWENSNNCIYPYFNKRNGIITIAIPQNLETLVKYDESILEKSNNFKRELYHLSLADKIFCISFEEQWVLAQFGIKSYFLPYYPEPKVIIDLLKIREHRKKTNKNIYLILGTAFNPPTFKGISKQIKMLDESASQWESKLVIAGYGTENLKSHCTNPNIEIKGSVDFETLNELLSHSIAVLVHQEEGTGALTRIPEMLIAGIPVICNRLAARSAFVYSGLQYYDNLSGLINLLSNRYKTPDIPLRPMQEEQIFTDCIQSYSG